MSNIIQSFWHGDRLSNIELLCINSFIKHGYEYHLYAYKDIENIPDKVYLKDANSVLDFKEFKQCNLNEEKTGNSWKYGAFSDIFRFRLLYLYGGWWQDTDSCCVKRLDFDNYEYVFGKHYLIHEYTLKKFICSGVMKVPAGSELFKNCFDIAYNYFKAKDGQVRWASIGPELVHSQVKKSKDNQYKILDPKAFCPIKYWETKEKFLASPNINKDTYCIHFYTSTWSVEDANKRYDPNTLIGYLYEKYC